MPEPLSIAISLIGLLMTCSKISFALAEFISNVKDAPKSARAVLSTIEETKLALEAAQGLFDRLSAVPENRKILIQLDHIAITLSSCILTHSELESLVCSNSFKGAKQKLKWPLMEKKVLRLLPRLESQKASLALMVTVLQW